MIHKKTYWWDIVFKLSRPAFWIYLAGPYLIGYTAVAANVRDYLRFEFFYTLFFFLIPANIIVYGINDIYDKDTDAFNKKKDRQESKHTEKNGKIYVYAILASLLLSIPLWIYLSIFSKVLFGLFLLLGIFYSAKPVRFKAKPFLDSLSNILYAFPAFIALYQLTNFEMSLSLLVAIVCWTSAMHLFSAIPDITADHQAKLRTTATVLGRYLSLLVCTVLWLITAIIAVSISKFLLFFFIYPIIPFYVLFNKKASLETTYWLFPKINLIVGFLLYLVVALL